MSGSTLDNHRQPWALRRRSVLAAAGLGGTTLLASGCSDNSIGGGSERAAAVTAPYTDGYEGPKVTITFWNGFTGGDGPYMRQLVEEFTQSHPEITVQQSTLEWTDFYSKVVTATDTGSGPDVAAMQMDQLASFAARGTIVPLDNITESLQLTEDDFAPAVWEGGTVKGERFGIPLDLFTIGQYWNTKLLGAAGLDNGPRNAEEFDASVRTLHESGIEHPVWLAPENWQIFVSLLVQFGGSLYSEDLSTVTFAGDPGVEALTWMRDLIDRGISPSHTTEVTTAFKNGSSALVHELPWLINDIQDTAPDLDYRLGPFPLIGKSPATFANSHNFTLTKQADQNENRGQAARTFISWMSENSALWAGSGNIPARASAREGTEFEDSPQAVLADENVLEGLVFLDQVPGARQIAADSYERAVSKVLLGEEEPAAALSAAADAGQEMLDRNLELYGF